MDFCIISLQSQISVHRNMGSTLSTCDPFAAVVLHRFAADFYGKKASTGVINSCMNGKFTCPSKV